MVTLFTRVVVYVRMGCLFTINRLAPFVLANVTKLQ